MESRLFLLDAMALIYRAYFALNKNPRINSKGLNTSAILGFANTLYDILKNEKPRYIGVAFDTFAPTLRAVEFTAYKAHREAMPEDIVTSLPYIRRLIEGFNIPILEKEGYEADDIIGTLAIKAQQKDFTTFMVTSDKDFGQLVTDKIFIYKPPRLGNQAEILGVEEVCRRYQIERPEQLIDILGLWGDASDNIPGIPGIGEKRAIEFIQQYGSVENLLANTDKLQGKMRENVEAFAEQGLLSKKLATIMLDVPVEFEEDRLILDKPHTESLKELFDELEFRTFAKRVFTDISVQEHDQEAGSQTAQPARHDLFSALSTGENGTPSHDRNTVRDLKADYHLVNTAEQRIALVERLKQEKSFCFDTETTGLDPNNAELVGISFAFKPKEAFFVIMPENYQSSLEIVRQFKPFFEDKSISKTGQNLKYDIAILKWYEVEVKGKLFDTMLAHYLIEPDMRHNMDYLAETYLNYKTIHIDELIGKKGKNQLTMRSVMPDLIAEYACEDADITLQLRHKFDPLLDQGGLRKLFDEIEIPLVPVLASMEAEGVMLDTEALKEYSIQLGKEVVEVEKQIFDLAGQTFNISSPKQLGEILFEKLRITDKPSRTATKQYSTGEEILVKLLYRHPIVQLILDYRSLTKLKSTYVDTLPELISPRDRRIHTSYNQAVAATGRLSSNNPNMQNIPIRTERGREIRKAFVPRNKDYIMLSADYSQIELRIIAELSEDTNMLEAFRNGIDIHTATAAKVYGLPLKEVTSEMRRNAKMVNFGIIYGISAFGLSERLNIPRREAADIIEAYFRQYPGIKQYMEKTIVFAREHGYVETVKGRRRHLRDINSGNAVVRGFAERNAINAPIQGSSADMIKIAMIRIYDEFNHLKLKSRMILQVHDELVFDVHRSELEIVKPIIQDNMQQAIPMSVPILVEMNTGENWLEAH
ncbi:MAG: DNA polymerase I [Bacteroidales bacterium]|nr:DNA polymerase I [Bacteroidales bacterium]